MANIIKFENARVRANRNADAVRVNVNVEIDDVDTAIEMGAKLALIRWQDECRRLNKLPSDGETVTIKVSAYNAKRRVRDPVERAKRELAKLPAEEREKLLRELGLL